MKADALLTDTLLAIGGLITGFLLLVALFLLLDREQPVAAPMDYADSGPHGAMLPEDGGRQ